MKEKLRDKYAGHKDYRENKNCPQRWALFLLTSAKDIHIHRGKLQRYAANS